MLRRALQLSTACTGLYCGHRLKVYHARCDHEPSNNNGNVNIASDTLLPSFKAVLISKLYNLDFHQLQKREVLIEIGLLSIPVLLTGIASTRLIYYSKRTWHRKDFYNIMNVSLNTIIRTPKPISPAYQTYKYTLYFRTLMEKEVGAVIPNEEGVKQLVEAAKKTTLQDNPLIVIENKNHYWTVCNQIANEISSLCAAAFIHRDIVYHNRIHAPPDTDHPILVKIKNPNDLNTASNVEAGVYVMALTCEPERSVRNRKIRVMLIQERMIKQLLEDKRNERALLDTQNDEYHNTIESGGKSWSAKLEDPAHSSRWDLIMKIVDIYDKQERRTCGKLKWAQPLCLLELCTTSYEL